MYYKHKRITNKRFSAQFFNTAQYLRFKSIGPFEKFLNQVSPNTKLFYGIGSVRVYKLRRELDAYKLMLREQTTEGSK